MRWGGCRIRRHRRRRAAEQAAGQKRMDEEATARGYIRSHPDWERRRGGEEGVVCEGNLSKPDSEQIWGHNGNISLLTANSLPNVRPRQPLGRRGGRARESGSIRPNRTSGDGSGDGTVEPGRRRWSREWRSGELRDEWDESRGGRGSRRIGRIGTSRMKRS